jgi:hypothetical protein
MHNLNIGDLNEFGTFIRIIYDLQVAIDFYFHGDARLGSRLLKYEIFRGRRQNVSTILKNSLIQKNMLYLGSLLHGDVKTVAYFKHG